MKNSNVKTNLTRKATAIASAVMTLSTAAVLAMAPMSQAQAVGVFWESGDCNSKRILNATCKYRVEGGAFWSQTAADNDAKKRAKKGCPDGTGQTESKAGKRGRWGRTNWYYSDLILTCQRNVRAGFGSISKR